MPKCDMEEVECIGQKAKLTARAEAAEAKLAFIQAITDGRINLEGVDKWRGVFGSVEDAQEATV